MALQQDIVLFENGRRWSRARERRGFRCRRIARSRATSRRCATSRRRSNPAPSIYIDQGYVDAHIIYPIDSPNAVFAMRTTAGPELGDELKLAVRYHPSTARAGRWS